MKTHDTKYTVKHDKKRNAKRKEFKFYLDDDNERKVYYALQDAHENREGGAKGLVVDLVLDHVNRST